MKQWLVIFALAFSLSAQTQPNLTLDSNLDGVNTLTINDFDFLGAGNVKEMFRVTLIVGETPMNVQLRLTLTNNGKPIVSVNTNTIQGVVQGTYSFSNQDVTRDFKLKTGEQTSESLKFEQVNFHGTKLFDGLTISPKLPGGNYVLKLSVVGYPLLVATTSFRIQNNWTLLLSDPAGDIATPYPTFRWSGSQGWFNTDDASNPELTLYVYEDKGDLSKSISSVPMLTTSIEDNTSSLTFPADNARQLEAGKSYYWTIKVKVKGIGGHSTRDNEFIKFTYTSGNGVNSEYDEALQEIIGPAYLQVKKELAGYKFKSISVKKGASSESAGLNLMRKMIKVIKDAAKAKGKTARINVETID